MTLTEFVSARVRQAYGEDDIPCAPTVLRVLSELFSVDIGEQVFAASHGMNGAGKYGAQCGLVEGSLMFIGVMAHNQGLSIDEAGEICHKFASAYQKRTGSLQCSVLRPEGFNDDNPPDLCEPLTVESIIFAANFMSRQFGLALRPPAG